MKKAKTKTKARRQTKPKKATDHRDITELMLRDHKPLKKLLKIMKKPDHSLTELQAAFRGFAPLLEAHAVSEQESLYTKMESDSEEDIRVEGFEGFTEHGLADELAKRVPSLESNDDWRAQVKVLAELVEHHIEEEEEDMIPDLRKDLSLEERVQIGEEYLRRYAKFGISEQSEAA